MLPNQVIICRKINEFSDGSFLTFNASGELRVEKNSNFEAGNNNVAKLAKWTIIDANNPSNKDFVTPYDDVALKSPFGNFLIVEPSSTISASGPNITEDSTFKLLKANIPFLPDWVVKR